ncbi:MAG: PstS family phosphate ABC transporter substrate-binding protein [Myxococcales bacterium FL481]|nr:MAG: PstS family phosphate ABC transporter substrate-binding protein [Myxococcales bacterium FL481]
MQFKHLLVVAVVAGSLPACGGGSKGSAAGGGAGKDSAEAGTSAKAEVIKIDGSSTVFPITEAVAEEFQRESKARVTIGVSGTGGGFKKFCAGETVITGASRPIRPSEVELCGQASVEYIELPVAYDGIAIVVHKNNDWVDTMTVAELATLWRPESQDKVKHWNDVRTGWPEKEVHLYGPGVDSGTYDYFTKAIVGKEHSSRGDFTSSEDDNALVQGVTGDPLSLGFFGFAYYSENKKKLKVVPVDDGRDETGAGPILPTPETIADGTYQPLSRPVFIYVNKKAAERAEVSAFIDYYIKSSRDLVAEVGYIPLPAAASKLVAERFEARTTGSLFAGEGSKVGATVESLLAKN